MGNITCIAGGGTPYRSDITICNQTDISFIIDDSVLCTNGCNHKGFIITSGKVVDGCDPPDTIGPYSISHFSVSGREGSSVAPIGKVCYRNDTMNIKMCVNWACFGWSHNLISVSSSERTVISATITGKSQTMESERPWHELISLIPNSTVMELTIKPKAAFDDVVGVVAQLSDKKLI